MGARPNSKFIGGQGFFKQATLRNQVMRFDISERTMRAALKNTATFVNRTDFDGGAITPDGLYALLSSTVTPFLRVLDAANDAWITPIVTLPGSVVNDISFNSSGDQFAIVMQASPFLYRYSYPAFGIQTNFPVPPTSASVGVSYNGAGTKLAVALAASPFLELFDIATLTKEAITWASMPASGTSSDCAFSPDGTKVALVGSTGLARSIRVWNYPAGTLAFSDASTVTTNKVVFSPDGSKMAVNRANVIRIYNTTTWAFTDISPAGFSDFYTFAFRNMKFIDNRYLFHSSEGGSEIIIDTTTGLPVAGVEINQNTSVGIGDISPLTLPRRIAGHVENSVGAHVSRKVRAYDTATGTFLGETVSDPSTGAFDMQIWSAELCTVYALGSGGENAKIYDPVTPAV